MGDHEPTIEGNKSLGVASIDRHGDPRSRDVFASDCSSAQSVFAATICCLQGGAHQPMRSRMGLEPARTWTDRVVPCRQLTNTESLCA